MGIVVWSWLLCVVNAQVAEALPHRPHIASSSCLATESLNELLQKCCSTGVTVDTRPHRSSTPTMMSPSNLSSSPTAFASVMAAEGFASSLEQLIDNEALSDVAFDVEGKLLLLASFAPFLSLKAHLTCDRFSIDWLQVDEC